MADLLDMTADPSSPPPPVPSQAAHRKQIGLGFGRWLTRHAADVIIVMTYLAAAAAITGRLWRNLDRRTVGVNPQDHAFFQWVISHAARVATDGVNPFVTDQLNAPAGVNLMANTSILGLALPLTPVTLLWGPQATFATLLVLGLAGTAAAWYWLLSRHLVRSRLAAAVGGGFCGFAPGMIAHAQGHVNWTAMFLVPFLLRALVRLGEPGRMVRGGLVLGLLTTAQAFINEEVLFYTGLAAAVFLLVYAVNDRAAARAQWWRFLGALAVAGVVAGGLLAVPLWAQFTGAQSYRGIPESVIDVNTDLGAYPAFARRSVAGSAATASRFAQGPAEENAFFGWPLLLLATVVAISLWRSVLVRAASVTGIVFMLLSLGRHITVAKHDTGIRGPWALVRHLPLFDAVVPTRLALVAVPVFGLLLALAVDRLSALRVPVRVIGYAAVAAALVPLLPTPIPVRDVPAAPRFIAAGTWRDYVPPDRSMVLVPVTTNVDPTGMRWAAWSDVDFAIAGGYFLGPGGPGGRSIFGAPLRPTEKLFRTVARTGSVPKITSQHRRDLDADLAYWRAAVLVLQPDQPYVVALNRLLTQLLGPGRLVDGVWIWDVRDRVDRALAGSTPPRAGQATN